MLIATFVTGLLGLVADHLFLRPAGGIASPSANPSELLVEPDSHGQDPTSAQSESQSLSVAQRLDNVWSEHEPNFADIADPFCLPASWLGGTADEPAAPPDPVATFIRTHQLSAVVMDGRESYVLMGDHFLAPGQEIDGFKLIAVGDRSAVFEGKGQRVVLELVNK